MYFSEAENQRMELEAELGARADYLIEAFGDEARLLSQQAYDDLLEADALAAKEFESFVGPRIPVQYVEAIGPDLEEDLPF
jgi:hypothetical protein